MDAQMQDRQNGLDVSAKFGPSPCLDNDNIAVLQSFLW